MGFQHPPTPEQIGRDLSELFLAISRTLRTILKGLLVTLLLGLRDVSAQVEIYSIWDIKFESEFIWRGAQYDDEGIQPSLEVGLGSFYTYLWGWEPIDDENSYNGSEFDIYLGYFAEPTDDLSIDVGFTYFWYLEDSEITEVDRSREIFLGVSLRAPLKPTIYLYYDIDFESLTLELSVYYSFDLQEWIPNSSIEISAYAGSVDTDDLGGGQVEDYGGNSYSYYEVWLDYAYKLSKSAQLRFGLRFSGNNDGILDEESNQENRGRERNLWWGTALHLDF